jgi:hypothetical protein
MSGVRATIGWVHGPSGVEVLDSASGVLTTATQAVADESFSHALALRIVHEIHALGWEHVNDISDDNRSLSFICGETFCSIALADNYPASRPVITSGPFPDQEFLWCGANNLKDVNDLFTESWKKYAAYFEV